MEFSLSAAAKAAGKGKSTIHHAIKTGKLSARREEDGSYKIDAAELARVFTLNVQENAKPDDVEPPREPYRDELVELRVTVAMLREQLHREEAERKRDQVTIEDLRKRLDDEAAERRNLLRLMPPAQERSTRTVGFLGRLLGRS